ncbi:MAG: hypothetical protein HDT21_09720 [Ruminococcus sp.]|nr:hypothetical protein [Ruminococcus sp.]
MKKILKIALSAAILCLTAVIMSVCVFAETEDIEMRTVLAKVTNGAWGQSITYDKATLDCSRLTSDSEIQVEFELDGEWNGSGAPVELVFQNYSTADPAIWAKIAPYDFDDTTATFRYEDMVAIYGSEDLSTVDAVHLGDCGIPMKVTKFVITNCEKIEITTTTTAATTEAVTEAETEAAETTAVTTAATEASSQSSSGGNIPIVPIVIVTVVVAVIIVVVIIVLKNRKRFY